MRGGQDYKVMNETFGERQLRREHLRIIIAAPQPSTFFASSVCLAQTRIVAFRSEESSWLPPKVSRQKMPIGFSLLSSDSDIVTSLFPFCSIPLFRFLLQQSLVNRPIQFHISFFFLFLFFFFFSIFYLTTEMITVVSSYWWTNPSNSMSY